MNSDGVSQPKLNPPNIFAYHDYCKFLEDWFGYLKSIDKKSSLRKIGKDADISAAYLSLVLAKKRSLSAKLATKLAEALNLDPAEQKFFILLVSLADSSRQPDRLKAYQKIKRFTQYQETNDNQIEAFKYMSEWYFVAIRELAAHPDFTDNPKWIQKQLVKHVPTKDITNAIEFLLERGFIKKNKDGSFQQPQRDVDCNGGVYQISLNRFHHQILDISSELLDHMPKEERYLSGYTFMMSPESYDEVNSLFDEMKNKLREIEDRDRSTKSEKKVYHTEFITIPLSGKR
jgi:uncharacterized protein (TIGR02147 family)